LDFGCDQDAAGNASLNLLRSILVNRPLRLAFVLSAGLLIALSLAISAYSAPETPTPTPTAIPGMITPSPSECQVEPLPMSFFEAYIHDPSSAVTPPATAGLPVGTPESRDLGMVTPTIGASTEGAGLVDSATTAALTGTIGDYLACFNANEYRRMWALLTARYLDEYLNGEALSLPDIDLTWLERSPGPKPADALVGFIPGDGMTVDAEGRICTTAQLITQMIPDHPSAITICFIFERGRYRIDQLD
jgi:hypothetical protein